MSKRNKKNKDLTEYTADITHHSHDGRGIAHIDGKTTFLSGGLPVESVQFRYTRRRSQYDEGQVTQVLTPSVNRTSPRCAHFGVCGGCLLQHANHEFQLQYKQQALLELLQHQASIKPDVLLTPLSSSPWGYRRKARLSVKYIYKKEKLMVGFREKNSHLVADIAECEILHPKIGKKITALIQIIQQLSCRDKIPQLEVAVGDDAAAIVVRHLSPFTEPDLTLLTNFAIEHDIRIYLQPKGMDSIHLLYPTEVNPLLTYRLTEHQIDLQFFPTQFIQVNAAMNEQMINQAITLLKLEPTDVVLDLFCGIGNFSLPIAKLCQHVIGVEGDDLAVKQAKQNADLNNITNAEFHCADLSKDPGMAWTSHSFNKVLLDPPRTGALEIIKWLIKYKAQRIVYISCNPATLARDAKVLIENGFKLSAAGIMDMFPHTAHVEAITLFEKI